MMSVLILTLNEEMNLPRCLQSVKWCDDVVVLDSFSTDRTEAIARAHGARLVQRRFDSWSDHQNWALKSIPFKYPWVYYSDADEIVTPDLKEEMIRVTAQKDNPYAAYRVRYKNYFMGRWIRHCGIYPVWILRLFRPEKVRWERLVNPVAVVDGREGKLEGHFEHYSFGKGLAAWFEKHNRYSSGEAQETLKAVANGRLDWMWVFQGQSNRRRVLKELSVHMPCRPFLRFLYMYVLNFGFLDGVPGYHYCRLLTIYEYMIVLKVHEIRRQQQGLSV